MFHSENGLTCSLVVSGFFDHYLLTVYHMIYFYRPQTKFAKVMFSQVSVYPRGVMHGRGACMAGACMAGGMHGGACTAGGACMAGHACTHTPRQILRDMVNERAVKECRSIVREEALYLTMLSAVTPTL